MANQYATYEYYLGPYAGTTVTSSDFPQLVTRASSYIDKLTFNRAESIITDGTDPARVDAIQMATCAVVDALHRINTSGSGNGVKSESVGGHSVTYADGAPATYSEFNQVKAAAGMYLGWTGLMFSGFAKGEYSRDGRPNAD